MRPAKGILNQGATLTVLLDAFALLPANNKMVQPKTLQIDYVTVLQ